MTKASWKNRRRMAWLSFGGIMFLLLPAGIRLIMGDDPNTWVGLLGIIVGVLGAIVLGYTGFATYEDVQKNKADK